MQPSLEWLQASERSKMSNWVAERAAWAGAYEPTEQDWSIALQRVAAQRREAFADTLARVVFDEIERGETDGSYMMDGRKVAVPSATELYMVGGAGQGIVIPSHMLGDERRMHAGIEMLREKVAELEGSSDDRLFLGTWLGPEGLYLDISNGIDSYAKMVATMAARPGELAVFDAMNVVCIDRDELDYTLSAYEGYASGAYGEWNASKPHPTWLP